MKLPGDDIVDPTAGQTETSIGTYLRRCKLGSVVAIRETHGGWLRFVVTIVADIGPSRGRLYTEHARYGGTAWYIRTGRSCFMPTGQSHLVEPTDAIRAFMIEHPDGVSFMYRIAPLYGTD